MSLVNAPLTRTGGTAPARANATVRAMQLGQHLIVLLLTAVGVVRAIGDGTPTPAAVVCGIAVLAWHTAGSILAASAISNSSRLVVWWLLGFAVIWLAVVVVSAEFVWLAFLLWLLAGHLLPLRWGLLFSGEVLAIVIVAPILHHGNTSYANVLGPVIGGVFAFGISRGYLQLLRDAAERERLVASLTNAQHEMAELQDELALAQRHSGVISERTRLSRDIHDTVAQGLSSIRLLSHAAGLRVTDSEAKLTFSQVESLASDNLGEVRRIIAALAPAELEADALAAALDRLLSRVAEETGLQGELHADASLPLLPTEVEVALLRTAQSALANVRVHAQASRVVVSLIDADDSVRLDIIDDGAGFDASEWDHRASEEGASSYGLRFMRARLRELGGGLDVESAPGEGTAVTAHLPIYLGPDASSGQTHRANEETL